jgi:hypothetical protein
MLTLHATASSLGGWERGTYPKEIIQDFRVMWLCSSGLLFGDASSEPPLTTAQLLVHHLLVMMTPPSADPWGCERAWL